MDSNTSNGRPVLPASTIAILMALLGAILIQTFPFIGTRPSAPEMANHRVYGMEDVPARLWEDPFEAISPDHRDQEVGEPSIDLCRTRSPVCKALPPGCRLELFRHTAMLLACQIANSSKKVTVLGVMVVGGPYAEDAEARIRKRYAVLSALDVSGYTPEDAEHIGFVQPLAESGADAVQLPYRIPYEWFIDPEGNKPSLLLLWLEEDAFLQKPLQGLARLARDLDPNPKQDKPDDTSMQATPFRLIVLGPATSTGLEAMIKEVRSTEWSSKDRDLLDYDLRIYSPTATADDALLLGEQKSGEDVREQSSISGLFAGKGIKFVGTINTDGQLAKGLAEELALRRALPGEPAPWPRFPWSHDYGEASSTKDCPRNYAVLLAEWDTLYGRSLPRSMIQALALALNRKQGNEAGSGCEGPQESPCIYRFSYLRGIDGQLPEDDVSQRRSDDKDTQEQKDQSETRERPAGRNQFDYLRRLVSHIKQIDDGLRRDRKGAIRAIGVLGSDVYDKLLALQALRPAFPGAVIFTTDLDARLWHSSDIKWSRNLIVASGFGLNLTQDLQRDIPPFRGSYQTSVFFTTLLALNAGSAGDLTQKTVAGWLQPRVFEIGRRGPFELTGKVDHDLPIRLGPTSDTIKGPYPDPPSFLDLKGPRIAWGLLLAILVVLAYSASDDLKRAIHKLWSRRSYQYWTLLGVLAVGGIVYKAYGSIVSDTRDGEPFSWTQGISMWPTFILWLVATALSVLFLVLATRRLRESSRVLAKEFLPNHAVGDPPFYFVRQWREIFIYNWVPPPFKDERENDEPQRVDAQRLWIEYQFKGKTWARIFRVAPVLVLIISLVLVILEIFGYPEYPLRGDASFRAFHWIAAAVFFGLIALIFFVADATRLCRRFIQNLTKRPTQWPEQALKQFENGYCIDRAHIGECIDMDLIAKRAAAVARLAYFPFIVLFVLLLARLNYFDNLKMTIGLILVYAVFVAYTLYSTLALHRTAITARDTLVSRLENELICVKRRGGANRGLSERLQLMIDHIRDLKEGAFRPLLQQPAIRALMWPLGGLGLSLADYWTWSV